MSKGCRLVALDDAIKHICEQAAEAVRAGKVLIVLSDRNIEKGKVPANAIMVTGAVHHHLINVGLRADANLIIETGLVRDSHQLAVLLGFGATAVYPYLAYNVIADLVDKATCLVTRCTPKITSAKAWIKAY